MNESARQGQHGEIIAGLQQESRQLRELQTENRELKIALEDYQNAIELIMSKYRSHTSQLLAANKPDLRKLYNDHQNKVNLSLVVDPDIERSSKNFLDIDPLNYYRV